MAITIQEQGITFVQYVADGTTANFPLIFEYLEKAHVKVFNGTDETTFTWLNDGEVTPDTLPANNDIITIRRFTPNTERLVDYQDGGQISEALLDKDSTQLLYIAQEAIDTTKFNLTADPLLFVVDFKGNRGVNAATPVDGTDVVNKDYISGIETDVNNAVITANQASQDASDAADAALAIEGIAQDAEDKIDLHLTDDTAHDAEFIVNTPAGNITAIQVQAALNELDSIKEDKSNKGIANGYAGLDGNGKVPAGQLPSFVDDVEEYDDFASFPVTGESGKIYVAKDTGKVFRWATTVYAEISPSEVNSVNGQTGAVVLDKTDVGLDQVDNTSDATKNAATANLTNKSLIDPNRLDAKKDTLANLTTYASTAGQDGEVVFATDTKSYFGILDSSLSPLGGGSEGVSFLNDPSFEQGVAEWTCVDATITSETSTDKVVGGGKAAKIEITADGGYCQLTHDFTGLTVEDMGLIVGAYGATKDATVSFEILQDGVSYSDESAKLALTPSAATQFDFDYFAAYPSSKGVTGIKVSGNLNDIAYVDEATISLGKAKVAASKECSGDLDCENVFTLELDTTTVTKDDFGILKNCTSNGAGDYTCEYLDNLIAEKAAVFLEINDQKGGCKGVRLNASTNISFRYQTHDSVGSLVNCKIMATVIKQKPDYKTTQQQGVVLTGGNSAGALLSASNSSETSNTSIATTLTKIDLKDVAVEEGIGWDNTTSEGTVTKTGKYLMTTYAPFFTNDSDYNAYATIQVDSGTGFVEIDQHPCISRVDGTKSMDSPVTCPYLLSLKKGDKFRMAAVAESGDTQFIQAFTVNGKRTSPRLTVVPVLTRAEIAAEISRKVILGQEQWFGDYVDGEKVYQYCNEVATDITTSNNAYDSFLDASLKPFESQKVSASLWYMTSGSFALETSDRGVFLYNETDGDIEVVVEGRTIFAGTTYCIQYRK